MSSRDKRKPSFYLPIDAQEDIILIGQIMTDEGTPGVLKDNGELNKSAVIQNLIEAEKLRLKAAGLWKDG